MITEQIKQDFITLIQEAPVFTPPEPSEQGEFILPDDLPDTVAAAFEKQSKVNHRYNSVDRWSIYSNSQYQQVTDEKEIRLHIRKFVRKCNVKQKKNPTRLKQTGGFIKDVQESLSAMPEIHLLPHQKAPCSLDGKLDPATTIALDNGLLDLSKPKEPKLLPFTPNFYSFNYLPVKYNPDAKCPTWLEMLNTYFPNDPIASDVIHSWQKRWLLRTMNPHKLFAIIGAKRSGKGTIARITQHIIGDRNVASLTVSQFGYRFGLQCLLNKQLGIMWDARLTASNMDANRAVEVMLGISGEDKFTIDRKNTSALENIKLNLNILLLSNKMLSLRDDTGALASRFSFLETQYSFHGHEDPTLEKTVIANELPGILNLILQAPDTIVEHPNSGIIQQGFTEMSSPHLAFVHEWCDVDPNSFIPRGILYLYYVQWCELNRHNPGSPQTFKNTFRNLIPEVNPDFRPRLTGEEILNLKYEFKLDQKVGPDAQINSRPWCYGGLCISEEIKNVVSV